MDREDLRQIATLVKGIPEDEPSLAWRAQLNAKLESVTPFRRRRLSWPLWSGAVATAAICAVVFFGSRPDTQTVRPDLAATTASALVNAHVESVARQDLGLASSSDLKADRGTSSDDYNWDVVDLSTL